MLPTLSRACLMLEPHPKGISSWPRIDHTGQDLQAATPILVLRIKSILECIDDVDTQTAKIEPLLLSNGLACGIIPRKQEELER